MEASTKDLLRRVEAEDPAAWAAICGFQERMPAIAVLADETGDIPADAWTEQSCEALNLLNVPPHHGGSPATASALRRVVLFEQVGKICPGLTIGMPGPGLSTPPFDALATASQKANFFGQFHSNLPVWGAFAITEPQSGSDATAMRTVARRTTSGDYVINGEKCFVTNGARATSVVVFASINPEKGRFGVRAFVVHKGTPGFRVDRCEDMLGLRASQLAGLSFVECRVSEECMLGHDGNRGPLIDAFAGAQEAWNYMRPALAACMNGACMSALEQAHSILEHSQSPHARREAAVVREEAHTWMARVEAARLLVLRTAWRYDCGDSSVGEASMVKVFSSSLAAKLAGWLMRQFPLHATRTGHPLAKFCRDARGFDIIEGTGDMQRLNLARALTTLRFETRRV